MANSEGRAGGMNFHPKQLQKEWKPKDERFPIQPLSQFGKLMSGLDDVEKHLKDTAGIKAGSTVCEHLNEPFECPICRRQHAKRV